MRKAGSSLWAGLLVGAIVAAAGIAAVWALARQDPYAKKGPHLGADAVYDLTELRKVDPERILYDQAATLTVPFDDARAIAVGPAGRVYVASRPPRGRSSRPARPPAAWRRTSTGRSTPASGIA